VDPEKRRRWIVKIGWRIAAVAFILGCVAAPDGRQRVWVAVATAWFVSVNLLAKRISVRYVWVFFLFGNIALLLLLSLFTPLDSFLGTVLLAAIAHLAMVISDNPRPASATIAAVVLLVFLIPIIRDHVGLKTGSESGGVLLIALAGTYYLVQRARHHNAGNVEQAIHELTSFKGYSAEQIRHLWAVSNQELAKKWQEARLDESDAERMAAWYRANSELYLFAISAYNLEYKRIRSTLNILNLARGRCLDYGAGNGEVLLELAARQHRVAYYDVDGETMRFAMYRAQQRGLNLHFFHSKVELGRAAASEGFDTIFALDVLEHIPDLQGELKYLASLLNPGGLFVFDVPAGATKNHPMHLNHEVDVVGFLRGQGLKDERGLWGKLPFRKEEKYFFRAGADRYQPTFATDHSNRMLNPH
jgi:2-polyprenyl-3-methyl-5-hydroxy-6-metoxy-1,4-benzoquinol methylase